MVFVPPAAPPDDFAVPGFPVTAPLEMGLRFVGTFTLALVGWDEHPALSPCAVHLTSALQSTAAVSPAAFWQAPPDAFCMQLFPAPFAVAV
jgi:hypothetical protein